MAKERPDFSERRISGETVFSGNIISVYADKVSLPDGGESSRETVRHPGAAVIVPLLDDKTVLLEWQFRYPLGKHIWELPAGKLDAGESPRAAAERELLEETGYRANLWEHLLTVETSPGFCDERAHIYLARGLEYEGHPGEADEFVAVEETPLKRAAEMIQTGEITDATTIIGLWRVFAETGFGIKI
ncbi:MAG: NUDIX hydrolase [Betaproteobacteria bacterium]|nr:NUDIX hydrolase [Betaproteobacteria bacterium]